MWKIKKKDTVMVLAGRDKGKRGEVNSLVPSKDSVIVTGINMVSKHAKASKAGPGGIQKKEAPIHISKVALVCSKCDKSMRPKSDRLNTGEKVRVCRKCGNIIG